MPSSVGGQVPQAVEAASEAIGSNAFAFLESGLFWGFLGAALCALLAFIGSARGVNIAGEAAAGLVTEDPSMFGKIVIIENLPATQAIYGLLIAFVAVSKLGLFAPELSEVTLLQGALLFLACMPMGIVGLISAIYQGRTAAATISILTKNPNETAKCILITAMVETFAIFALLISFLLVNFIIK
ncbi:MAG: V-type ATP synthase subunit K [Clostridia bacterium]|nr:V-type ATP synthase subunit K [Clostridia bacterium]